MSFIILYCTLDMLLKLYNVLLIFCKASKSFTLLDSGAIKVLIIIIIMLIIIIIKFINCYIYKYIYINVKFI